MINDHTYIKRCNQAMVGAIVKWCLGRRQLAHSSASKLHCDYLQVFLKMILRMVVNIEDRCDNNNPPVYLRSASTLKSSWEAVLQVGFEYKRRFFGHLVGENPTNLKLKVLFPAPLLVVGEV